MTTLDFIIALFYQVANLHDLPKHSHATLWPSAVVTLGILHALKGVGNRAFYRWLTRDYRAFAGLSRARRGLRYFFSSPPGMHTLARAAATKTTVNTT
jgi:hypothetical protein